MSKLWQWIQGFMSRFRSNPVGSAFGQVIQAIEKLPPYLQAAAIFGVLLLGFVGILDYLGKLAKELTLVLAGAGVLILLFYIIGVIAQLVSDRGKRPPLPSPAPLDPLKMKILSYIATHDALSVEEIAHALNAQVDQVNNTCATLLSELRVGQAAGQFYITDKGREYLRTLDR